jgi:hypothetical protein
MKNIYIIFLLVFLSSTSLLFGQLQEYRIHDRGMLHQTVYNTGELGRPWATGSQGNQTSLPLMEWPSRSAVTLNNVPYSGQHNILGAGVHFAANPDGSPGQANRQFAHCGGVGAALPEISFGVWSFPKIIKKIENYPILADGTLNPAYNPDEAEEIITASWATPLGIKVTRTSRAYSYPDYDDFIIYEYEFEFNGDIDGSGKTLITKTWKDLQFSFVYGFGQSMYGYQRHYNDWKYDGGLYKGDQDQFWDADYWLTFNMDRQTALDPALAGKPEPDSTQFGINARTGAFGGGLCSPQAPGFAVMYFDTTHLAIVDPNDTTRNESEFAPYVGSTPQALDAKSHIKQPWTNRIQTGDVNSQKMETQELTSTLRSSSAWSSISGTNLPPKRAPYYDAKKIASYQTYWPGRAKLNNTNTTFGRKNLNFGPYTMRFGDKIRFTVAEVVGYGAAPYKPVEGGRDSTGKGVFSRWNSAPSWHVPAYSFDKSHNKVKMTNDYLKDFGYPDYVNSNVHDVMQVAHKAFEAYLGLDSAGVNALLPIHPDSSIIPSHGVYNKIPVPPPAPGLSLYNTDSGSVVINWNNAAELFSHPKLTGKPALYRIWRAQSGEGPWKLLGTITAGAANRNSDNLYSFIDDDQSFSIGESSYYSVTSEDAAGNRSGRTNITLFQKNIGAAPKMGKVYAVPNPFISKSGFQGTGNVDQKIGFYGLPERCTIRIFSFAGNLVQTIEHDAKLYTEDYFQVTRNGQEIASGIYFFVVTTPAGEKYSGKFVVIK